MVARLVVPAIALAGASLAAIIQVQVGAGGLKYSPATITASQGDIVEFIWNGEEHSVSQADESSPCHPASNSPFNSGAIATGSWYITINNTDPIYYYCGVRKHCQLGMVGGINLPSTSDFSTYQSASSGAEENVLPSVVEGGAFGTPMAAAASSSSTTSASSPSSAAAASSTSSSSMSSATAASMATSLSSTSMSSSVTAASSSASSSRAVMSSSASAASMSSTASSTGGAAAMATHVAGLVAGLPLALAVLL